MRRRRRRRRSSLVTIEWRCEINNRLRNEVFRFVTLLDTKPLHFWIQFRRANHCRRWSGVAVSPKTEPALHFDLDYRRECFIHLISWKVLCPSFKCLLLREMRIIFTGKYYPPNALSFLAESTDDVVATQREMQLNSNYLIIWLVLGAFIWRNNSQRISLVLKFNVSQC